MERTGIHNYTVDTNEFPGCDLFGEQTNFRFICSGMIKNLVEKGKWFAFCTRISEEQVNIMGVKNQDGVSVGSYIKDVYELSGYRTGIYKYLLKEFLCYYEVPSVIKNTDTGYGFKSSYNKYLVTSNIRVVAEWLGVTVEEADALYGSRLSEVDLDNEDETFQYVKLYETKDRIRKVTKPRKDLDLSSQGTRVTPLFALKAGVDTLYEKLKEDTYDIKFFKDGGQERVINTTFNLNILRKIYTDAGFLTNGIQGWYDGEFITNSALERGYIRIFEVGSSIYDSPLRSINYARIISLEKAEPDLAYLNVDLDSVVQTFTDTLYEISNIDVAEVVDMLDLFNVGTSRKLNNLDMTSVSDLETWSEGQVTLLSTVFKRQLALFMIGCPQWFKDYTGAPKRSSHSANSLTQGLPFDEEELDFA